MLVRVKVKIGEIIFNSVNYVECHTDIKNFTGTAKIKLPKKIVFKDKGSIAKNNITKTLKDYVQIGDPVEIYMGYDNTLIKRFTGYVTNALELSTPIVLECEDEMYKLKQKSVNVSIENATIKQVVGVIANEYETEVLDAEIGDFSMKNTTGAKVLYELKKRFGLYSYFIDKKLIVGKPFTNNVVLNLDTKVFDFNKNVISSDLKYLNHNDHKLRVKAISILPDNSKHEVFVGDKNGETRTLHFFDIPKTELERLATEKLNLFKKDKLTGRIKSFGFPIVQIGQKIQLVNTYHTGQNSTHYVDEVKEWIDKGYRREITIGKAVD